MRARARYEVAVQRLTNGNLLLTEDSGLRYVVTQEVFQERFAPLEPESPEETARINDLLTACENMGIETPSRQFLLQCLREGTMQ